MPALAVSFSTMPSNGNCSWSAARARSGDPLGLVDILEIGHEQGELVTAKPGERIARGDRRFDLSGHVTKHPITDLVAQRVVDVLESIEVEQHQPDQNSGPAGIFECLFEAVAQQRAIG